jgi:hypothetical protein
MEQNAPIMINPSPPKLSKLTGRPPVKRGTVFMPSLEEVKVKMEADAYSGKSSYISDLQLEELKKVVAKAAAKSDEVKEKKMKAELDLIELEKEITIERLKYEPLCVELAQKKEHMRVLKDAFEKAKQSINNVSNLCVCCFQFLLSLILFLRSRPVRCAS